ncbi:unnamed protein product [Orchesella dallaii]|uniref:RBR-type E3 ubiquitin transferase n=1 Tax=Orchesella dallaii TaxID=48710 RepID=A0ABP1RS19_9HEXA
MLTVEVEVEGTDAHMLVPYVNYVKEGKRIAADQLDCSAKLLKKLKLHMVVHDEEQPEEVGIGNVQEENDYHDAEVAEEVDEDFLVPTSLMSQFEILDPQELPQQMNILALQVQPKLEIGPAQVILLLNHFNWDVQKLFDSYFDENDCGQYFRDHGLPHKFSKMEDDLVVSSENREMECGICFSQFSLELQSTISYPQCQHHFCPTCSCEYIKTRIFEHGLQSSIQCPEVNCKVLLHEDYIKNVLHAELEMRNRYDLQVMNDFVIRNKHLQYCPGERCSKIWKMDVHDVAWNLQEVACYCGQSYCFSCTNEWHFPLTCKVNENWMKRVVVGSANLSCVWIYVNTKSCPSCSTRIEKNGGCNHMTCERCHHQFCWLCRTSWSGHHGPSICTRSRTMQLAQSSIAEPELPVEESQQKQFSLNVEKYLSHGYCYNMEKRLLQSSVNRMDKIRMASINQLSDALFYENAIKRILECRKFLQYSFAFIFYLDNDSQSEIFKSNIMDLDNAVDELAYFLQEDVPDHVIGENQTKIMHLTNYCKHRREALIGHASEGYFDERWRWSFNNHLVPELI